MGKPYKREMLKLFDTYNWCLEAEIENLCTLITSSFTTPLLCVGSGGSYTAAKMAALLHEKYTGLLSKAVTPYEFVTSDANLGDTSILLFTASGKNSDIISAYKHAEIFEPKNLSVLCMKIDSVVGRMAKSSGAGLIEFPLPSGKDGFLATNSLLAQVILLIRAYSEVTDSKLNFDDLPWPGSSNCIGIEQLDKLLPRDNWIFLYGKWGTPAAFDVESKFTEAALCITQVSDYRNFAHGRHHWIAKRGMDSVVVALVTPDEEDIANRTLDLIPDDIPKLKISTDKRGPIGALALLIQIFNLAGQMGESRGIDPGRPGVPKYGSSIYHLKMKKSDNKSRNSEEVAIWRKTRLLPYDSLDKESIDFWRRAYRGFSERILNTAFGCIVFDYDGTICCSNERYIGPSPEITDSLTHLLENNIILGIATGRGDSVRKDLQRVLPEEHWDKVIIGYYNGGDIGCLNDESHPVKSNEVNNDLNKIAQEIKNNQFLTEKSKWKYHMTQISVQPRNLRWWRETSLFLTDIVARLGSKGVRLIESSHSIDIVAPGVSKLNLLNTCKKIAEHMGNPDDALCIGDKGMWPGNDFDLLGSPYSLSVDAVSKDPLTCWNLAKSGQRGVAATLYYLNHLHVTNQCFRCKIK